jgi:hypothetical protein
MITANAADLQAQISQIKYWLCYTNYWFRYHSSRFSPESLLDSYWIEIG